MNLEERKGQINTFGNKLLEIELLIIHILTTNKYVHSIFVQI